MRAHARSLLLMGSHTRRKGDERSDQGHELRTLTMRLVSPYAGAPRFTISGTLGIMEDEPTIIHTRNSRPKLPFTEPREWISGLLA